MLEGTEVPSVAAAVVLDGKLHAAGAVGVRKRGDDTPVTLGDKYHIGSCTKAMTATLAGILVERGLLLWETQLHEVFPEMTMHPACEKITLRQLLSHSSGLTGFTDPEAEDPAFVETVFGSTGTPMNDRLGIIVPALLSQEPRTLPGTAFDYSNMGYITAGAVFEKLTQTPFETLLRREVFTPLGLTSAGFGAAGTAGKIDEPYGHGPEPIEPGPDADNPVIFSPAGTVHMSVTDFARHAAFHLTGKPELISRETLELLHTSVKDAFALGWGVVETEWAGGLALTHAGSNGMFYAVIGVASTKNLAVVCACNLGTEAGAEACTGAFRTLIEHYS